ncbi:MAG: PAS domain S-box protein [Paludibacter sp.]|nr:PAS domain S-box protein [Paludibacter sp.]
MEVEIAFSSFQYNDEVAYQGVIHDISQRKKLLERNVLLSRAMEQSPVSIVITNSEATIEYVNPAYERSTGYTFEELIGRNQNILKSGHHPSEFYAQMWEQLKNGKIWQGEIKNRTKNGNILWESMSISPIFNTQGALEHFVGVKEDITAKMQTLEELRIAKEKAEESDRLKSAFLATMSHELRTPLNQIIGFSGIIPQMTDDDSIIEFASQINKSGNDLLALIEDIFQMSMVEKTPVVLRRNEVKIKDILHQLKIYLEELLVESGKTDEIRLDYSIQESLIERSIITDKPKLIQALLQIIKNAVKFTHKGVISLQFELTPSRILNISIKDTGIGIPAEKLNYIFDFFRQGDESLTRTYGGVGIGLALSKKIAEAMNARIHVTTRENVGSEFTFELPLDENSLL